METDQNEMTTDCRIRRMREWSASELDSYNKREQQGKQDKGKEPIKSGINVPRTASMPHEQP